MNREEYKSKLENELSSSGYSWLHEAHKKMIVDANMALIDIFTDAEAFKRFKEMCKSQEFDGLPGFVLGVDELDSLYDIASTLIDYDILDDGEMHIIYDKWCDRWILDRTYEFLEHADQMCKFYGIAREDMEIAGIDDWNRNVWKDELGHISTTLGLADFIEILKHIKSGDMSSIHDSLGLTPLQNRLDLREFLRRNH